MGLGFGPQAGGDWVPVPWTRVAAAYAVSGVLSGTLVCDLLPRISLPPAPFYYSPIFSGVPFVSEKQPRQKSPV